jgi:hypothetical protein
MAKLPSLSLQEWHDKITKVLQQKRQKQLGKNKRKDLNESSSKSGLDSLDRPR